MQKLTGAHALYEKAVEFRAAERTLQLELEEAVVGMLAAPNIADFESMRSRVADTISKLADLRGEPPTGFEKVVPLRPNDPPKLPTEVARDLLLGADVAGDAGAALEAVSEAFEAYHAELWAALDRRFGR